MERLNVVHLGLDPEFFLQAVAQDDGLGWSFEAASSLAHCLQKLSQRSYDVLLLGDSGETPPPALVVEQVLRRRPQLAVVLVAARPDFAEAMRLARLGLAGYVPRGEAANIGTVAERIVRARRACLRQAGVEDTAEPWSAKIVGNSPAIQEVIRLVRLIAPRQSTVLISGRTGAGKELVARAIHEASPRRSRPLVVANCGAIPDHLMEAEFFGHVKGAFTSAVSNRAGRFERAHGGTIFLDEIGELPLDMQAKLLRVLQDREFQRVGSSETVQVDVRVIAASNRDLQEMVRRGSFREDLYYRLNVVPMALPSLAERVEDIPVLVRHLLEKICLRENLPPRRVGPEALARLMEYGWPGNVRQLENALQQAVALSGDREILYPSDFDLPAPALSEGSPLAPEIRVPDEGLDFESVVTRFELSLLHQALERTGGNKKRAAELLRIKRTTFAAKLRSLEENHDHDPAMQHSVFQ